MTVYEIPRDCPRWRRAEPRAAQRHRETAPGGAGDGFEVVHCLQTRRARPRSYQESCLAGAGPVLERRLGWTESLTAGEYVCFSTERGRRTLRRSMLVHMSLHPPFGETAVCIYGADGRCEDEIRTLFVSPACIFVYMETWFFYCSSNITITRRSGVSCFCIPVVCGLSSAFRFASFSGFLFFLSIATSSSNGK